MFDLEKEVAAWAQSVHADRCRNAASVAELVDHLHCEIGRARAEGLSDERAFAAAVAKLGQTQDLTVEHAKNRSLFSRGCAAVARFERRGGSREHQGLLIAHAMIWAALMIAMSLMVSRSDASVEFGLMLTVVFVPLWFGSDQILRLALKQSPRGGGR